MGVMKASHNYCHCFEIPTNSTFWIDDCYRIGIELEEANKNKLSSENTVSPKTIHY